MLFYFTCKLCKNRYSNRKHIRQYSNNRDYLNYRKKNRKKYCHNCFEKKFRCASIYCNKLKENINLLLCDRCNKEDTINNLRKIILDHQDKKEKCNLCDLMMYQYINYEDANICKFCYIHVRIVEYIIDNFKDHEYFSQYRKYNINFCIFIDILNLLHNKVKNIPIYNNYLKNIKS